MYSMELVLNVLYLFLPWRNGSRWIGLVDTGFSTYSNERCGEFHLPNKVCILFAQLRWPLCCGAGIPDG